MYDHLVCSGKGSSPEAIEVSWKNMSELELWMKLLHHLSYIEYQILMVSLTLWLSPQLLQKFTPGNTSLHSQLQDRDLISNGSVECLWYYKIIRKNHRPQLYPNRFLILEDIYEKIYWNVLTFFRKIIFFCFSFHFFTPSFHSLSFSM